MNICKKSGVFGNDGNIDVIEILFTDIIARKNHSMVAIGTDIYIFGGYNDGEYFNDFYKIDTINCNVVYSDTTFTGISARSDHSMVAIGTDIYIYGGQDSITVNNLNDIYKSTGNNTSYFTGNFEDLRLYN